MAQDQGDVGSVVPGLPSLPAAQEFFTDPEAMAGAAKIFFDNGMPEGMAWLQRGHEAAKENGFAALQRLMAGDGDGAVQMWNRSGRFRDLTGAQKNADGTWTMTRQNGQTVNINPELEMRSFLSPKDYFTRMDEERKIASTESLNKAHAEALKETAGAATVTAQAHKTTAQAVADRAADAMEIQRLKNEGTKAVAEARAEGQREAALARQEVGYDQVYKATVHDLQTRGDIPPEKIPAQAQYLTRSQFTDILPQSDGTYALVDRRGGKPTVMAIYPNHDEASAAVEAWAQGKGLIKPSTQVKKEKEAPKERDRQLGPSPWSAPSLTPEGKKVAGTAAEAGKGFVRSLTDYLLPNKL